jgi:ABC-type lipoprotein export system ATPase subunit
MGSTVRLHGVTLGYGQGPQRFPVIDDLSLTVLAGRSLALVGPSGSGKSTLLNIISGLATTDAGEVHIDDIRVDGMTAPQRCDLRRSRIGFVFQAFHLLPHLSAVENAALGSLVRGTGWPEALRRASVALGEVGLAHRMSHRPAELSGGEQQRVALARVLSGAPGLVLADEPTGNLDPAAAELVLATLMRLRDLMDATIVVATHSPVVAAFADERLELAGVAGAHQGGATPPGV